MNLKYEPASEPLHISEGGMDHGGLEGEARRPARVVQQLRPPTYRGTSLIRNTPLLGPYSRTIPRVLWWS